MWRSPCLAGVGRRGRRLARGSVLRMCQGRRSPRRILHDSASQNESYQQVLEIRHARPPSAPSGNLPPSGGEMEHPRSSEDVDTLPTATQASLDPPRSEGRSTNQLRRRSPDWLQNVKLPESNSILRSAVLAKQRFNTSSIAPDSPLSLSKWRLS